jgi:hypothetical protein
MLFSGPGSFQSNPAKDIKSRARKKVRQEKKEEGRAQRVIYVSNVMNKNMSRN